MLTAKYSIVILLLCCMFVSGQRLHNAYREYESSELFNSVDAEGSDKQAALNAINLLEYQDIFGHPMVVNKYLLGYYYYTLLFDESDTQELAFYFQNAYMLFSQTIKQEPTNAKAWANLALLTWLNTQSLDEILPYVKQAHQFGKYNFRVHVKLSQLAEWIVESQQPIAHLPSLQEILEHHLRFGLEDRRSKQAVLDIINLNQSNKEAICQWLTTTDALKQARCD